MSHGSKNYLRGFMWVFFSIIALFTATMWDNLDTVAMAADDAIAAY